METAGRHELDRGVGVYFAVTFGFSWLLWLPAVLDSRFGVSLPVPGELFLRAGTFAPSVCGMVFAYLYGGRKEVSSLLRSMLGFRLRPGRHWFLLSAPFAVSAVSCLVALLIGIGLPEFQFSLWFSPAAFLYILIFLGPLGEEAGWRGFALRRLLLSKSPAVSAVLLGAVWAAWHLPLFWIGGTTQRALTAFGLLPALLCYLLYTVIVSLFITLLYVKSGGSVLLCILFHALSNFSLGMLPLIFSKGGAAVFLLVWFCASLGYICYGRKILFHKGEAQ